MGTMEIENISLDAVLVKHLLGKRINSRASVLELDGNGEFATQILLQVKNDRIASWDLDNISIPPSYNSPLFEMHTLCICCRMFVHHCRKLDYIPWCMQPAPPALALGT